jgi:hypothetical protein
VTNALEHQHTLAHTREPQVLNLLALLVKKVHVLTARWPELTRWNTHTLSLSHTHTHTLTYTHTQIHTHTHTHTSLRATTGQVRWCSRLQSSSHHLQRKHSYSPAATAGAAAAAAAAPEPCPPQSVTHPPSLGSVQPCSRTPLPTPARLEQEQQKVLSLHALLVRKYKNWCLQPGPLARGFVLTLAYSSANTIWNLIVPAGGTAAALIVP